MKYVFLLGGLALGACSSPSPADAGPDAPPADAPGDALDASDALDVPASEVGPDAADAPDDRVMPVDAPLFPARMLSPWSSGVLAGPRPTFRWAPRVAGAMLTWELCQDRACARVTQTAMSNTGSVTPSEDLAPGVWYWRVGGVGPVWAVRVLAPAARQAMQGLFADRNGDGRAELVAGAPGADSGAGRVYVLSGLPEAALSTATVLRGAAGASFGSSVAAVGDLDGDGFTEVAVGAVGAGEVRVYRGGLGVLEGAPWAVLASPEPTGSGFGTSLAGLGDLDGDGYADLAVGAPFAAGTVGRVFVWRGGAAGLSMRPDVTLTGTAPTGGAFGISVGGAGDLDGDGFGDFVVGAYRANSITGEAYVFRGRATLAWTAPDRTLDTETAAGTFFGDRVAGVGDLDGDGLPEFAVTAPNANRAAGRVHLYRGGEMLAVAPARSLEAPGLGGGFGAAIVGGADLDGDHRADLAVAAPSLNGLAGRVYLYHGGSSALPETPTETLDGPDGTGGSFGASLAAPGDLSGDGAADLLVGAPAARDGAGAVRLYRGRSADLMGTAGATLAGADGADGAFGRAL